MGDAKPCYVEAWCHVHAPGPNWWYEVSVDDPEEDGESVVVETGGMYASTGEALAAGASWAAENGYVVLEREEGDA